MNYLQSIKEVIKKLKYILEPQHKSRLWYVFMITLIAAFLELLGVSVIKPFMEAITNADELAAKPYMKLIMRVLGVSADRTILIAGLLLIVVYIGKNLFMVYSYHVQYDYSSRVGMELSMKMLRSYMSKPYETFTEINSAEVLRGCTYDTNCVYGVLYCLIQMTTELISVVFIIVYLMKTDIFIALSVAVLMGFIMLAMVFVFKPIFKRLGNKLLEVQVRRNKTINQMVNGIKEIFVFRREKLFIDEYEKASDGERFISKRRDTLNACPDRITEAVCVSGIIAIIIFRLSFQDNVISFVPKLSVFAMAAFKIFPSVGKITTRINTLIYYMPALDNVYKNIMEAEKYSSEDRSLDAADEGVITSELREIVLDDVSFKYNKSENSILDGLSMSIRRGESIGIIGESGAGKTTLSDIILGILTPQKGKVLADGVEISKIKNMWAEMVGYVPQGVFIMDDTIRENILFGLKEEKSPEEIDKDVWESLRMASLDDFVRNLPEQLDTVVGERGIKFSGGQRQRLAIARALYLKPEVLVLDEATAALDNETESAVMESIESLQGKVTLIIIAHRLSTIKKCDKVYEVVGGKAVQKTVSDIVG